MYYLGIRTILGRRNSESRIRRRTLAASRTHVDADTQINEIYQQYSNKARKVGKVAVNVSKKYLPVLSLSPAERHIQGKQALKQTVKSSVGVTYRAIFGGTKHSTPQTKIKRKR